MWLGEQITDRGVGNGMSLIIFAGIVARMPSAIGSTFSMVRLGEMSIFTLVVILAMMVLVIAAICFVEQGQRRLPVQYAKRVVGRKMYGGQSTHLPLKVNTAGVIPPIFASSLLIFPGTIAQFVQHPAFQRAADFLQPGGMFYNIVYVAAIIFFCFFYTALQFNARDTADNLKRGGAFVPGIRPGEQTAKYIDKVMTRLTFVGALYITAVCLLPEFLILYWNVPFYFGGTSLLIIVVVVMDFMAQIQSHLMSHQYEGIMKKANLDGYKR